jgi:choline kinase
MVEFNGRPIIDYILESARLSGIQDIVVVCGYKENILKEHLKEKKIEFCTNHHFNSTNMVSSLFCAENKMDDDIIISYADIVYRKDVLDKLIEASAELNIVVDKNWKDLWSIRMEDPLSDAETLKINSSGNISELGKKPQSVEDIQGQYIGLIKIRKKTLDKIVSFYHSLDTNSIYDGKNFNNMFMTSFLQLVIDKLIPATPVFIEGGWVEIDSVQDLKNYEYHNIKI